METSSRAIGMMRRLHSAMLWTLILIVVGCLAGAAVVLTADSILTPIGNDAATLTRRTLPADIALEQTSIAARVAQVAFLDSLQATNAGDRNTAISRTDQAAARQDADWATYMKIAGHTVQEQPLQAAIAGSFASSRASGALLLASSPTDPAYAANLASERGASANGLSLLDAIQARFYDPTVNGNADAVVSDVGSGRSTIKLTAAAAFLAFLAVGALMVRRVRRDGKITDRAAAVRAVEHRRSEIETRLQRALEMESTEDGTYDVLRQALGTVAGGRAVELLVADNSQAHFRQVLSTVDDGVGACRVAAPGECPAASSGQTRRFEDSDRLDTCPYLRKHPERVWASCIPVSIAGRTTGVLHAEGPIDSPANDDLPAELELVSRKAGDRIGVIRVLASTEAQAQADPLTGLPNRRTLENRTHTLLEHDTDFVVAFADLDHFKNLNDLHGHETGDRALRLFARVLRDTIRPRDIPARYGGEEFVVVLPDCSIADARVVAERVRSQLAVAIGAATVPSFTVSVGLAAANPDEALSEVIARADAALLKAKQIGRDRVVVAGEPIETKPASLAAIPVVGPAAHN